MKNLAQKTFLTFFFFLLGLVFLPRQNQVNAEVGSYFFYWWLCPPSAERHCRTEWMPFVPPNVTSYYHPNNISWWEDSINDMIYAGVDQIYPVVWHDCSISVLENLVTAAQGKDIEIGFFGTPITEGRENYEANLDFYYQNVFGEFFRIIPQSMWATVGGRPIIVTYHAFGISGNLANFISGLKSRFQSEFGVEPFVIVNIDWFSQPGVDQVADGSTQWGAACSENAFITSHNGFTVGNIGPGEDTSLYRQGNPEHGLCVNDREGDGQLTRQYNQAAGAHLILVESWNELYEGTGIERANYPEGETFYLDLLHSLTNSGNPPFSPTFSTNWGTNLNCAGEFTPPPDEGEFILPPTRSTEWGPYTAGRGVPCGPGQTPTSSSPWRPYPGDADRFLGCLDLVDVHYRNELTVYCNPAPEITDTLHWFPFADDEIRTFDYLNRLRAWWIDVYRNPPLSTQIPFLGSSLTSSREFTEASQRMSLFLTDFLRGTVYWDRQSINLNNLADYRRISEESGPIRKLYPESILRDDELRDQFIRCRLRRNSSQCDLMVSTDPVHDYLIKGSTKLSNVAQNTSAWDHYFPLTSRDDVPAFVDLGISTIWPTADGLPLQPISEYPVIQLFPQERTVPSSVRIEDLYQVIESYYFPGFYFIRLYNDDNTPKFSPMSGEPVYEVHLLEMLHIPYIAESKELSEWTGKPVTPFSLQDPSSPNFWEKDSSVSILALDNPWFQHLSCNVNDIVRGGPGDTLATDFRYDPPVRERLLPFYNEWVDTAPADDWGCYVDEPWHWPNRRTFTGERNNWFGDEDTPYAWITTKIPYLGRIAKRTIGQAGIFKTLLPYDFNRLVIDNISEIAKGRILWYELPGYGPARFEYNNPLTNQRPRDHWGCCYQPPIPPTKCGGNPAGQCLPALGPGSCPQYTYFCGQAPFSRHCAADCVKAAAWCCINPDCTGCAASGSWGVDDCVLGSDGGNCICSGGTGNASCIIEGSARPEGCAQIEIDATGTFDDAPCWCAPDCNPRDCGPYPGPTLDSNGQDYRGVGNVNSADARFYYPYIGTIDIFRKYLMNEMVPHQLTNLGSAPSRGAPPPAPPPPGATPTPAFSCPPGAVCVDQDECDDGCIPAIDPEEHFCPGDQICCVTTPQIPVPCPDYGPGACYPSTGPGCDLDECFPACRIRTPASCIYWTDSDGGDCPVCCDPDCQADHCPD